MPTSISRAPITFVCVATGDFYGLAEVYIHRMFCMLQAHVRQPFQLYCITDRERKVDHNIKLINCSAWNELKRDKMRPTTTKLGLFNPDYVPTNDFIYLDLTLVIKRDMSPLIDFVQNAQEPLVIIKSWYQDTYNSSVMRIKPHALRFIYDAFCRGEKYPQKTQGDQDFIHAVIKNRHKTDVVTHFPSTYICSFKKSVRTARHDRQAAKAMIDDAIIVKFHGNPRMHNALNPWKRFLKYTIGNLWYRQIGLPFDLGALQRAWEMPLGPAADEDAKQR